MSRSALRVLALLAAVAAPSAVFATEAVATGVIPGSFSYKLHATVPLHMVEEETPILRRAPDVAALFGAPFSAQAGEHADLTVTSGLRVSEAFAVLEGKEIPADVVTELPPGPDLELGDVPACGQAQFLATVAERSGGCPAAAQVGIANVLFGGIFANRSYPLYKLAPAPGHLATVGFPYELISDPVGVRMNLDLRADGDYGLTLSSSGIGLASFVPAPFLTIWGVPGAPAHDFERWDPESMDWGASLPGPALPLVANAADCEAGMREARLRLRYWEAPGVWLPEDPEDPSYRYLAPPPEGCDHLAFNPEAEVSPAPGRSGEPTGINLRLRLPRNLDPAGPEAPPLENATLSLPPGTAVNPGFADGLAGCTAEQIGLEADPSGADPARFSAAEAHCPAAARLGEASVETPIAAAPLQGAIYFATPYRNPFHSPLALYLVLPGPGFTAKLPVEVGVDPGSGRLTATIESLPQLPVTAVELDIAGGPRAPLLPAPGCGEGQADLSLTPWSAPGSGPPARIASSYAYPADGCTSSTPELQAGSTDAAAGAWSPFVLHLRAEQISSFSVTLPPGLMAAVQGVTPCDEAAIAAAAARRGPGGGAAERRDPSCPASSRVGLLLTELGSGPAPLAVPGSLYLAGPYAGSPFSLVAITPALGGGTAADPLFDLGTIVERVALAVDPRSGALTATAMAPSTLNGLPLRVGTVDVTLDRPGFVRNPTRCANMAVTAELRRPDGATATAASGFRVSGCAGLRFAPRLRLALLRGAHRGDHPTLRLRLRASSGEAGIAAAHLTMPGAVGLDRGRLRGACPVAAATCPRAAIRGRVTASSALLGQLEGPVFLRSQPGGPPELVLALGPHGALEITGQLRQRRGRVGIDFTGLPDAGLTGLEISLWGGRRGLFVNSRDLCGASVASALLVGASGGTKPRASRLGGPCPAGQGRSERDRKNARGTEE